MEGFPSGQRDQTVNLTAQPSKVRILLPPPSLSLTQIIIFKYQTWPMFGSILKVKKVCGGVPEWPKGSDCKSDGSAFEGSNPSPSTISLIISISLVQLPFCLLLFIYHSYIYSFCSDYILCIKLHFCLKPSLFEDIFYFTIFVFNSNHASRDFKLTIPS